MEIDFEKININKITDNLYFFIMHDWKSTSLITEKKTKEPKNLKKCINDIVKFSFDKSHYWISSIVVETADKVLDEKIKECKYRKDNEMVKILSELKLKVNEVYNKEKIEKEDFNNKFINLVLKEVKTNYIYTEQLRPNYWEQFVKDYYPGKGLEEYKKNYEKERKKAFKGLELPGIEETYFYNNIALPFIAEEFFNNKKTRIELLTDKIVDYVMKLQEFKNTHKYTSLFISLKDDKNLNKKYIENQFDFFLNYRDKWLDIEKKYKENKRIEDLNNVINKIKAKN